MHDRSEPYYYNSSLLYTDLVGREVCTQEGILLGWVSSTCLDENADICSIILVPLHSRLIPVRFLSTYEMHIDEIVAYGADRLIVIAGAEKIIKRQKSSLLEKLGIVKPPWERPDKEDDYLPPTPGSGRIDPNNPPLAPIPRKPSPNNGSDSSAEIPLP